MSLAVKSISLFGKLYHLVHKIGEGGFGNVYFARDEKGKEFAIKVLAIRPNPEQLASFKNEFHFLTQLKHPFLCPAHDFGYSEELKRYLFIADYAPGETFFEATQGKSPTEISQLIIYIAEVLEFLHLHGIVHSDIKCFNIIVQPDKTIRLLDFGIAKPEKMPLDQFQGTVRYSPPEILQHSQNIDHRADLYSLGIVLYRALTRHFPFPEKETQDIIEWHLHGGVSWTEKELGQIPYYLRKLTEFLLKKNPSQRISRARSVINWIKLQTDRPYDERGETKIMLQEARLLAREREVALAQEVLAFPSGEVLLFTGEEGSGKSRLLREIKYMAEVKEMNCLWLDDFSRENGVLQLSHQLEMPHFSSPDDFFRLSIEGVQKKMPLALFIDDLDEADPFLSEWLMRVYERRLPIAIFASWGGPPPASGPLVPLFQKVVSLAPLTRGDFSELLSGLLVPAEVPPEWVESLYQFSGGIPLLVTEGIRHLMEQKESKTLPRSIEQLYHGKLLALSPEARTVLETLALWKRPATLEDLSETVPSELSKLSLVMPHLISQGLVIRAPSFRHSEISYQTANTALGAVLKQMQDETARKERFKRILLRLEERRDVDLDALADYAIQACDPAKARKYLFQLGENYEACFQTQKAIQAYQKLLPLAAEEPSLISRVRKKLIPLLVLSGKPHDALSLFPPGEKLLPADRRAMGWVLTRSGRFREALALYQKGIDETDPTQLVHLEFLNDLANVYVQTREIDKSIPLFRRTIPENSLPDKDKFRRLKNNNLGLALALAGDIAGARKFEEEKLELFKRLGEQHQIAAALSQLGFIELKGQRLQEAAAYFTEALGLSEKLGDLHNILILLDNLISISKSQCLYHEALRFFSKSLNYRSVVSSPHQIFQNYLKGVFLYLTLGMAEAALGPLKRMGSLLPALNSPLLERWHSLAWGYYHRVSGHFAEALEAFGKATAGDDPDPGQDQQRTLLAWGHYVMADLLIEQKRYGEASQERDRALHCQAGVEDEELDQRIKFLSLLLERGERGDAPPPMGEMGRRFLVLGEACEKTGLKELAAEIYAAAGDGRAREIYLAIASHLPEEYRLAYESEPHRSAALSL